MITDILLRLDNRYPSSSERARITEYLASVPRRLAAFDELRATRKVVIDEVMAEYAKLYPRFKQYHPQGWEKTHRDLDLCVAFCANAVLLGETDSLDNGWLWWFRTIIKSVHLTPQFMLDSFRLWHESARRHLSDEAYELARPVIDHIARRLCDIPEPARPEVGERRDPARNGVLAR